MTLFGNRVFVIIIQMRIKMRSWTRVGPKGECPCKRQKKNRLGKKKPRKDRGRALEPRDTWRHQELEEAGRTLPLEPSEGAWPCRHLDFELLASRTVK